MFNSVFLPFFLKLASFLGCQRCRWHIFLLLSNSRVDSHSFNAGIQPFCLNSIIRVFASAAAIAKVKTLFSVLRKKGYIPKFTYTSFLPTTGSGRYSVKCEVTGGDDTQVNEGFIVDRYVYGSISQCDSETETQRTNVYERIAMTLRVCNRNT